MPILVDEPTDGDNWQHEIKYDGYRTQLHLGNQPKAFTRNGHDWSDRYAYLLAAGSKLPCTSAVLDWEVIVQDRTGKSDFHSLRTAIQKEPHRLVFMAFDLLELDGRDLTRLALEERRERLADLVGSQPASCPLLFSSHVIGGGALSTGPSIRWGSKAWSPSASAAVIARAAARPG